MDVSITKGIDIRKEDTLQELTRIINDFKSKKVYRALLTQTGGTAPTVIILENTIGNIIWTRSSAGYYLGTLVNAFTANKTFLYKVGGGEGIFVLSTVQEFIRESADVISITWSGDSMLVNHSIEIIVYV